ncbi:MAG: type I-C CRISPR-associated protein Cas5 [Deltaproteobacteria bacterium]|nr:type I-C CRISPR-associated protein Cas5 [Deltaproteobacteria bacterium]MBQ33086.1 type I-C CRISPR-associated protein Cas5 [Deltaproteobacteria bacterium]MDP7156827.1 type I-C CRISPR-associated protein Cas5c [SAR324 cluster bacterium]MDP7463362.1 type I-C CRISPR-associated protein Cas5c [SAR324 cluster bacterium]MDP7629160.1 type I-C CRISPR-associated protein Cas5c [SAR324 cluster bacterium]
MPTSFPVSPVLVSGEHACFTRPEMKVERVSYEVMTPSAARGVLEAILWKPAIRWVVTGIDVLKPIRWITLRRNEVGKVIPAGSARTAMTQGTGKMALYVEDERQQRAGLFLRDVAYVIHAHFELTENAREGDTMIKFAEMFKRRLAKGQCFHRPYLGCREFAAHFEPIQADSKDIEPIKENRDLGWMFYDYDYSGSTPTPCFFHANLDQGRMAVPELNSEEVRS